MKMRDFLSTVWGSDDAGDVRGIVVIAEKLTKGFSHYFCESISNAVTQAKNINAAERDCYFALALFREASNRKRENAVGAYCFWLDLDCGPGKPFADQPEAALALRDFCRATGLPRPMLLVSSGYGVHVYWLMSEFIPAACWIAAAVKLKALCEAHNFKADPSRTADIASVLRPVGTRNFKDREKPREVTVLFPPEGQAPKHIVLATFETALDAAMAAVPGAQTGPLSGAAPKGTPAKAARALDGLNDERRAAMRAAPANITPREPPPETPEEIERAKSMLAAIPGNIGREEWRNVV